MSIEAMKQALEALEWNYGTDLENIENCTAWLDKLNATITALRQAIEQAEKQEGWVLREVYFSEGEPISHREPQWVGLTDEELPEGETYDFDRGVRWAERYLKQKAVPSDYLDGHQPDVDIYDVWVEQKSVHASDISQERVDETAKREHEWVGLTDEAIWLEYQCLWPFHPAEEPTLAKDIAKFARAIEAKLKEKNNG